MNHLVSFLQWFAVYLLKRCCIRLMHAYSKYNNRTGWDLLSNNEVNNELPPNYEQLKTSVNRTSNWRERLDAVEKLGQWKSKQTIDVLTHRMNNDHVYKVQEAAYRILKQFGEEVQLPSRKVSNLSREVTKILVRIKKSLPADHAYPAFKEKFEKMRLDLYDVYEGEKGDAFDEWLEAVWASLSTK
jgi:hypothetical protein